MKRERKKKNFADTFMRLGGVIGVPRTLSSHCHVLKEISYVSKITNWSVYGILDYKWIIYILVVPYFRLRL
jgi:hypothetical protein